MEENSGDTQARFFRKEPGFFVGREFCAIYFELNLSPQICADQRRYRKSTLVKIDF
jgi:hypothetical protein